ncbi:HesA/MoeB/ThiF family protein [Microbacterium oxydans]|uniref:HesA/MoeB/ThiF family protein n=1 Tax=Microbacterium oxydans TaxID=82380 RepID=UPI000B863C6B|nr:HesA/MoeB/ThiF family protein [Microbacterium oxydans]
MPLPPLVEPVAALSAAEAQRTARHLVLADLGELGQRRLRAAHVAVVGAGGLGSPVVLALAAAGVGTLTVIDDDVVELSNLQRQVLHRLADVDAPKVDSAVRVAADLAPETTVLPVRERLTATNAEVLLAGADLVIDGSDTFETRTLVAAACERLGVPLVWGVVQEFAAQVTVFWSAPPAGVPPVVLSDLYPPEGVGELPSCAAVGVLGALCLQVGSVLAMEAIKLIAGIGEPLFGRVLLIDALRGRMSEVPLRGRAEATSAATSVPARAAVPHIAAGALDDEIAAGAFVLDVREADEIAFGAIPGSRHAPLAEVLGRPEVFAAEGRVVVVCRRGVRAVRAAAALRSAGADAVVLTGGMDAWSAR